MTKPPTADRRAETMRAMRDWQREQKPKHAGPPKPRQTPAQAAQTANGTQTDHRADRDAEGQQDAPESTGEPMPASFNPNSPYAEEVINRLRILTYRGTAIIQPTAQTPEPLTRVVQLCNEAFQSGLAEGRRRVASCQKKEREAAQ